jgi:lipopolysaccharide transport system ATP-binding protein
MSTIIKVEGLSKQYRLGLVGTATFKEDLHRWFARLQGKDDPFLKIGAVNDRTIKDDAKFVWSLQNINFDVQQGDVLGIIGRNGAGKSTLLKILSKVTAPTTGSVKVKGRIASLLEVGTGFHPELTGRENIYLNGAILGMRKIEIRRKLDEIIAFAGVEKYIDTPVKRYSSGMYVRLAFAVAAHLESEILIIDEVLAVGDTEFQQKCLGKMGEVSKSDGRTILFVSHNISAIRNLCQRAILLNNGKIEQDSDINTVLNTYSNFYSNNFISSAFKKEILSLKDIELIKVELKDIYQEEKSIFEITDKIILHLTYLCSNRVDAVYAYLDISNNEDIILIQTDSKDYLPNVFENLKLGVNNFKVTIPNNILSCGEYKIRLTLASPFTNTWTFDDPGDVIKFKVVDTISDRGSRRSSLTSQFLKWENI